MFHQESVKAIEGKLEKPMATQYIQEVDYPNWWASVVFVSKGLGKCSLSIGLTVK